MNSITQKTLFKMWHKIRNKEILVAYVVWIRVDKNRAYTMLADKKLYKSLYLLAKYGLTNQLHTNEMERFHQNRIVMKVNFTLFFWTFFGNDLQLRIGETLSFSQNSLSL